ncbi:MAG: FAD binding domain-containing protein [Acidimicrobiia bacterium]
MKPAPFDYLLATSVEEAVAALAADDDAKVIAGGQSLTPLLSLRLARPSVLVDVGRLPLTGITVDGDVLELGALVRHRTLESDALVAAEAPLLAVAAPHIGHPAIRARGTLGGSLAPADPAAELPAVLVALDAVVVVQGPGGRREVRAAELFEGYFTTALAPDELVVAVRVPRATDADRFAFEEWAPRHGDFATAGIALAASVGASGVHCGTGRRARGRRGALGPKKRSSPTPACSAPRAQTAARPQRRRGDRRSRGRCRPGPSSWACSRPVRSRRCSPQRRPRHDRRPRAPQRGRGSSAAAGAAPR